MFRKIATLLSIVVLSLISFSGGAVAKVAADDDHLQPTREACDTRNSPGPCYWDANDMGTGTGTSFWREKGGLVHPVNGDGRARCQYADGNLDRTACWRDPVGGVAYWINENRRIRYIDGVTYMLSKTMLEDPVLRSSKKK